MRQVLIVIALATAACQRAEQPLACRVLEIFPAPTSANASAADWGAHINSCVAHWARSLAASPDSTYAVVDAVAHVCDEGFDYQAAALNREMPNVYPDIDATIKRLREDERGEALAEVEAFREAKCKGPDDPGLG